MTAHLYRVIQPVSGIDMAVTFYSAVLEDAGERVSPGRHYFRCGGTVLACYDPEADGDAPEDGWRHHFNQYLYFAVPNLDDTLRRVVDAGGRIDGGIEDMPWGERLFYARDPFGNPIAFVHDVTVFVGADGD